MTGLGKIGNSPKCSLCGKPSSHLIFTDRRSDDPIRNDSVNVSHCDDHTEEEIREHIKATYARKLEERKNVTARP